MSNKLQRSGKPCPECNKYLYWSIEQDYIEDVVFEHKVLLCPACGYIEPHKLKKHKKLVKLKEME
jgi:DNA-directed RNA polymerase subunit M/transcription elongation factor TFIIS